MSSEGPSLSRGKGLQWFVKKLEDKVRKAENMLEISQHRLTPLHVEKAHSTLSKELNNESKMQSVTQGVTDKGPKSRR